MTDMGLRESKAPRRLKAELLVTPEAIRESQSLRFSVFSSEFNARLEHAELGLDMDEFDAHCRHIGVRDLNTGCLVASTRMLDHDVAVRLGRFYSEGEFQVQGLTSLDGKVLEVGRTCVHPAYRNGATIAVLWTELVDAYNQGNYRYLMGCASIPMTDGGIQARAIMQRLREKQLVSNEYLCVEPRHPLPSLDVPDNVIAEMPPLLRAYTRLGARICGEPCWDQDFQVADVFILVRRDDLCPRYARHFKAAV